MSSSLPGYSRQVSLQSVPELQAGVRISTPGAELDASTASLLADRDRIHSLLLEAYQAADPGPEPADA